MAKNIALTLTLNGVEQTITTIQQLEAAVIEARNALSTIELGSEQFRKFSTQVQNAESKLKDLKKGFEGKEAEQKIGAYAKIGSAITASFAAAQVAVQLFGAESEDVAAAATAAQQAITIALVGRELAEAAVQSKVIATTIATAAETAATNAANTATKAFYTTLAANPFTALLVAIGLVVTGIIALVSSMDDAEKKTRELEKTIADAAGKEIANTELLIRTVNDQTIAYSARKKALDELTTKFPGYFADLNKEAILNGKLRVQIDGVKQAILDRARASAYADEISKNTTQLLLLEAQAAQQLANLKAAQENLDSIQQNITSYGQGAGQALGAASVRVRSYRSALEDTQKQIDVLTKKNDGYATSITKLNKNTQNLTETTEEQTNGAGRAEEAQRKLLEALKLRLDVQTKIISDLNNLNQADITVSVEILDRANEFLEKGKALLKEREDFYTTEEEKFADQLKDLLFTVIPTAEELKSLQDTYIGALNGFINSAKEGTIQLLDDSGQAIRLQGEELTKFLTQLGGPELVKNFEKLNKDASAAFIQFVTRFSKTVETYSAIDFLGIGDTDQFSKDLIGLVQSAANILQDESLLPAAKQTEIAKLIDDLLNIPVKTTADFTGTLEQKKVQLEAYNEQVEIVRGNLLEFVNVEADQINVSDGVSESLVNTTSKLIGLRAALGDVSQNGLQELAQKLRLTQQQIETFTESTVSTIRNTPELLQTLLNDIQTKYTEYVKRFGEEGLSFLLTEIGKSLQDLDGLTREQLLSVQNTLFGFEAFLSLQFGPAVVGIFDEVQKAITKALKAIPTAAQTEFNETLSNIQKGLDEFQGVLNNLSQTFADYYSGQLDKVEKRNTDLQEQIVGDTEQANQKRIDLEKAYQFKKSQLEKQAARTSLTLSLVQATANVAESITKALTTGIPVVSQLAAAANAAIGAVQVGIIGSQLAQINSYQRGGTVYGPAHEYGGVKFQGGGIELEGGEAVINRFSAIQYGGLLDQINQAGGGRPLNTGGFDDSRIVEAIAKQRSEPIRAYVVEQDITNKQNVARRLEQLAQY